MKKQYTYEEAGVSISTGEDIVDKITRHAKSTFTPRVIDNFGGFGGLFSLDYNARLFKKNYKHPILVAGTDGVGTKLLIAAKTKNFSTIGEDLVAMCVNDIVVLGAEPLFFLDYIASSALIPDEMVEIVAGIARGCKWAECALIGGESAEMPGVYKRGDYELAGFAVGVVEKKKILTGETVEPGDTIIGLASSGIHSNGYTLARKLFFDVAGRKLADHIDELGRTLAEELLTPTKIYVKCIKNILNHYKVKKVVKGIAHITGGGLVGNIPRILPDGVRARISKDSWDVPPVFPLMQEIGSVADEEMYRVFNMGIGMALVVSPYYVDSIMRSAEKSKEKPFIIGTIIKGQKGVEIV